MQNRIGPNLRRSVGHPADARRRHQALLQGRPDAGAGRAPGLHPGAVPVVRPGVPVVLDRAHRRRLQQRQRRRRSRSSATTRYMQVADPPIGILFALAMSSIAVYGVMLAGWSSGSKYPLLGSVRASAQMVSYEAALGLSVVAVVLKSGTLTTHGIVRFQPGTAGELDPELEPAARRHRALRDLPDRGDGRAEPPAVRPRRGRAGARRRVPHRVQLDPLRAVLPRRVHEHVTMSAIIVTLFLGGPAGPAPVGPGWLWGCIWFFLKVLVLPVHVRVVPGHVAPVPLRPADGPRLEGCSSRWRSVGSVARRHRCRA